MASGTNSANRRSKRWLQILLILLASLACGYLAWPLLGFQLIKVNIGGHEYPSVRGFGRGSLPGDGDGRKGVPKRSAEEVLDDLGHDLRSRYPDLNELTDGRDLALLVFKEERRLEIWKARLGGWNLIDDIAFTGFSGGLGPKLEGSDRQIPEGVYRVESVNPNSAYHLSLKLDFPNAFDRKKAESDGRDPDQLGSDIYIHGDDRTVGCISIGEDMIEAVFYLVAKNGLERCWVMIAPRDTFGVGRKLRVLMASVGRTNSMINFGSR